jgi:biotin carboxyl carrier protein
MGDSSQQVVVMVNGREFLVEIKDLNATPVIAVIDGQTYEVIIDEQAVKVKSKSPATGKPEGMVSQQEPAQDEKIAVVTDARDAAHVTAPMPGDIVDILVQPGQQVRVGDSLCVLDAMKMKNNIFSSRDGRIASVEVSVGQSVDYGDVLITYEQ